MPYSSVFLGVAGIEKSFRRSVATAAVLNGPIPQKG